MNTNTDELARKLALAERALLAVEAVMAQAREEIETARQAIAAVQASAYRPPAGATAAAAEGLARPA